MPGARAKSVHLEQFPDVFGLVDTDLMASWDRLMKVRDVVNAALEEKRKNKVIGNSLGARVSISASGPTAALLKEYETHLPMLFIVSELTLMLRPTDGPDELRVEVEKASGVKCSRCWRFVSSVRSEPDWAGICDRCVEALAEPVNR